MARRYYRQGTLTLFRAKQQGFTLIELLIASSLLAMILLLGTYSYSLFANNWQKRLGHYHTTVAEVKKLELLRRVLAGVAPVGVAAEESTKLYFNGKAHSLTGFSRYGINTDYEVWFSLSWNPDTGSLWYHEAPVSTVLVNDTQAKVPATYELELFTGVNDLKFEYYGWNDVAHKNATLGGFASEWPKWHVTYNATELGLVPQKLRLSLLLAADSAPITLYASLPAHGESLLQQGGAI